jgi:hypothetical protein
MQKILLMCIFKLGLAYYWRVFFFDFFDTNEREIIGGFEGRGNFYLGRQRLPVQKKCSNS